MLFNMEDIPQKAAKEDAPIRYYVYLKKEDRRLYFWFNQAIKSEYDVLFSILDNVTGKRKPTGFNSLRKAQNAIKKVIGSEKFLATYPDANLQICNEIKD